MSDGDAGPDPIREHDSPAMGTLRHRQTSPVVTPIESERRVWSFSTSLTTTPVSTMMSDPRTPRVIANSMQVYPRQRERLRMHLCT